MCVLYTYKEQKNSAKMPKQLPHSLTLEAFNFEEQTSNYIFDYLDFSFDKGGNVILILKDGQSLQQVVFQPLPVLCDLFTGGSCRGARRESQCTQLQGSQEHGSVMFHK